MKIISQVIFLDPQRALAVEGGDVRKTLDGGKNWEYSFGDYNGEKNANQNQAVRSLSLIGKKDFLAAGEEITKAESSIDGSTMNMEFKPLLLSSEDEGVTWKNLKIDENSLRKKEQKVSEFESVCVDDAEKVWLIGNGGIVSGKIIEDSFKTEKVNFTGVNRKFKNIACGKNENIWAVDSEKVYHYQNQNWNEVKVDAESSFHNVRIFGDDIWLLGQSQKKAVLYKSEDNGQTWQNKSFSNDSFLHDVNFIGDQGWVVGFEDIKEKESEFYTERPKIYYTQDKGENWKEVECPVNRILLDIFFLDEQHGWIVGDGFTVLKYAP